MRATNPCPNSYGVLRFFPLENSHIALGAIAISVRSIGISQHGRHDISIASLAANSVG
ncbi:MULTISPECIES: hypothetical protein [Microcoleaceae]|uniref:hypothetical protein n=1 Tax=Microcoleaceae TaxID=1892252 RepID=UPI0018806836|nr:hypothetical protein [Tychonema sp. LEGE 06208]MBE9164649.1 hypothetical protein [Tychonema sp. LEGE 06208]